MEALAQTAAVLVAATMPDLAQGKLVFFTTIEKARFRQPVRPGDVIKLHAVKNTPLAEMVATGRVRLPQLQQYVGYVADFLEALPPGCVVDRLSGDAPPSYLVGPDWCLNKSAVRAAIVAELRKRNTWQGKKHSP